MNKKINYINNENKTSPISVKERIAYFGGLETNRNVAVSKPQVKRTESQKAFIEPKPNNGSLSRVEFQVLLSSLELKEEQYGDGISGSELEDLRERVKVLFDNENGAIASGSECEDEETMPQMDHSYQLSRLKDIQGQLLAEFNHHKIKGFEDFCQSGKFFQLKRHYVSMLKKGEGDEVKPQLKMVFLRPVIDDLLTAFYDALNKVSGQLTDKDSTVFKKYKELCERDIQCKINKDNLISLYWEVKKGIQEVSFENFLKFAKKV